MRDDRKTICQVDKADIRKGLMAVGLRPGDVVLAHASLSSFGHVDGGADAVIDALLETVGPGGTVVMPTFTWEHFYDKHGEAFDLLQTPSEVGRITEVFRHRPQALRSPHICHSVAAIGPYAAAITHETPSAYGPDGAFDMLIRLDAWNLFLGVNCTSCTALHAVEEQMQVPYREYRDFKDCTVVYADGRRAFSNAVEFLRKPGFWNDLGKMDALLAMGHVLHTAMVGKARLTNVRIRDIVAVTKRHLVGDIYFLLAADCRPDRL